MPGTDDYNSRAVTRWLEQKAKESMRRSLSELLAKLRAEKEERAHSAPTRDADPRPAGDQRSVTIQLDNRDARFTPHEPLTPHPRTW